MPLVLAAVLSFAVLAQASPIGTATYNGATFSLEYEGSVDDLYQFKYTLDFDGFTAGNFQQHLIGIDFKPKMPGAAEVQAVDSATTTLNVLGAWVYSVDAGLSNGGLCSAGTVDSTCGTLQNSPLDSTDPIEPWTVNPTTTDAVYTWTFVLRIDGLTEETAGASVYGAKLSAQTYGANASGRSYNTTLINLTTGAAPVTVSGPQPTAVPEPGMLLMFGAGLLGLAAKLRKS